MKKLSPSLLAETLSARRKSLNISQAKLSELTGINRALISRIESQAFTPSVDQLQALTEVLNFQMQDVIAEESSPVNKSANLHLLCSAVKNTL